MKKRLFVLGLSMCALQTFAQQGFYLAPSLGAGISNVNQDLFKIDPQFSIKTSPVFNYNAQLAVGYGFGRWRVETGLQYAVTGYIYKDLIMDTPPGKLVQGTEKTRYSHLSVPLRVGYTLPLGSRWSLSPAVGALVSYNLGARSINDFPGFLETDTKWTSEVFNRERQRISVWGTVALQAGYKASERITVFAGPSLQYALSNFMKVPANAPYKASERPYFVNMDAGVRVSL